MITSSFFWNCIASKYAKQPVADPASYQVKLDVTQQYLNRNTRLLEFGSGTGSTAIYHAPKVKEILALDFSARMLDIATEKAQKANIQNISFEQKQLSEIDGSSGDWDVVLGMSILHLLSDWEAHVRKAFSLLKPGGVFISSTPCLGDMDSWFKLVAPIFRFLPFLPNIQTFSRETFQNCLLQTGFIIEHEWCPGPDKALFVVARKPL